MAKLKTQMRRFLTTRLTGKIMDQMVSLDEENQILLRRITEDASAKLIKAYLKAIKRQHKNVKTGYGRVEKIQVNKQPLFIEPAVMAS